MPGKIFISYRRGDDPGFTQALLARLEQVFPREQLFMDVDSIPAGMDFVRTLDEQVAQCDVLLAVIGKHWIEARDETGARRLDGPDDFVRIEIESALKQGKRVIPVLVHDARMPRADELPEAIGGLARRHAVRLTHERFRSDAQGLVKAIEHAIEEARQAQVEAARQAQIEAQRKREEETARQECEAQEQRKREEEAARLQREAQEQRKREEEAARLQREADEQRKREEEAARLRREAEEQRRREEEAGRERARLKSEAEEQERREREKARLAALAALSPEQITKAEELANWEFIKDASRVQDLRDHLARYPGGVYERMARHRLAALAWAALGKAPDKAALKAYLEEFPNSTQAEKATARLARLERKENEPPAMERFAANVNALLAYARSVKLSQPQRVACVIGGFFIVATAGTWVVVKNWPSTSKPAVVSPQPQPIAPISLAASENPLTPERERVLKPNDSFKECAACPQMIVVPAGSFTMGSPASESGHQNDEAPQHAVMFARLFAVARNLRGMGRLHG